MVETENHKYTPDLDGAQMRRVPPKERHESERERLRRWQRRRQFRPSEIQVRAAY